jgi:hypothetical protein
LIVGYSRQAAEVTTPVKVQEVAADVCLEPALISSVVKPSVPETDGDEEGLGDLARMVESGRFLNNVFRRFQKGGNRTL